MRLQVPHNFEPRDYQRPFFKAMEQDGYKRALLIWSRRHGKDKTCFAFILREMMRRVGNYAYIFPTSSLARKAAWQNIDSKGFKLLDHIPVELVKSKQNQQMNIELINGSTLTFFGSEKIESVGTNYVGIVFSEFALQTKTTWDYMRPILRENGGWAVFNSTPRGRNHFYDMYNTAIDNENWYVSKITIEDTDLITEQDLEDERRSGMSEELIQQEYYCSFSRGVEGSYYGKLIDIARREGRITNVYHDVTQTYAAFDLGISDSTSIVVWQMVGKEIRVIDYYENDGEALEHYIKWIKEKDYIWGDIYLPHDAKVRELGTGMTRVEIFEKFGISPIVLPMLGVSEGIDNVRRILPKCWIDEVKCKRLIECLEMYHKTWNEKRGVYSDKPVHDSFSHGADAFRYLGIAVNEITKYNSNSSIQELNKRNRMLV